MPAQRRWSWVPRPIPVRKPFEEPVLACGGHLFTEHPGWGVVDVYAASITAAIFAAATEPGPVSSA